MPTLMTTVEAHCRRFGRPAVPCTKNSHHLTWAFGNTRTTFYRDPVKHGKIGRFANTAAAYLLRPGTTAWISTIGHGSDIARIIKEVLRTAAVEFAPGVRLVAEYPKLTVPAYTFSANGGTVSVRIDGEAAKAVEPLALKAQDGGMTEPLLDYLCETNPAIAAAVF